MSITNPTDNNKNFDLTQFNNDFMTNIKTNKNTSMDINNLTTMNNQANLNKPIQFLSLNDIYYNIMKFLTSIIPMLNQNQDITNIINEDNNMFYLGLILIFIAVIFLIFT